MNKINDLCRFASCSEGLREWGDPQVARVAGHWRPWVTVDKTRETYPSQKGVTSQVLCIGEYTDTSCWSIYRQMVISGVNMDHDDALALGAEDFLWAMKPAHHPNWGEGNWIYGFVHGRARNEIE